MATPFAHIPHPHIRARKAAGPPRTDDQLPRGGSVSRFNSFLALKITRAVGTMWCAYAFALLALVSLPDALNAGRAATVSWIAQTFLQLVLLPIIIVGQNVQATAADARSLATYNDASAVLEEARQIQAHLMVQDAAIEQILARLATPRGP